jgi:3-hydroxyisobutyrate dehydrogenase-like beta-hydroxyacid dehydrogenase
MEKAMQERLGFIGLGMMGSPMAKRLLNIGSQFSVYNRTRQKADDHIAQGARWCPTAADVGAESDIVFSMLANPDVLREITLGQHGIIEGLKPGCVHVDTSTVSPAVIRELTLQYTARGCHFIHAPVLGSIPQATDGTLLVFAGGDSKAYQKVEPALKALARQIWRFEHPEQATHLKLVCNLFIAGMITTLGEALIFAERADVDGQTVLDVISQSHLTAPMYQTKGAAILKDNFAPRFYLDHMLKDINLMLDAAHGVGAPLPAIQIAQQLFVEAQQAGHGREDYSAMVKALQARGGRK